MPSEETHTSANQHLWVLPDDELTGFATKDGTPLISPVIQTGPKTHNPNSGTYLLHIGKLYQGLPVGETEATGAKQFTNEGAEELALRPGDLAFIKTTETVTVPEDCLGIVFGTNSLTQSGILVVNPGYITAGHSSPISFVVVNFRKARKTLMKGDSIARIMVVHFPCANRSGDYLPLPAFNHDREIGHFSDNFSGIIQTNVEDMKKVLQTELEQSKKLAISEFDETSKAIRKELYGESKAIRQTMAEMSKEFREKVIKEVVFGAIILVCLALLVTGFHASVSAMFERASEFDQVRERVKDLEERFESEIGERVDTLEKDFKEQLEKRINALENEMASTGMRRQPSKGSIGGLPVGGGAGHDTTQP